VTIVGALFIQNTPNLKDLGKLEYIGDYLDLYESPMKTLGKLKKVMGDLYLGYSEIETLGDLEHVEKYLSLGNTPKLKDLGKLNYVGGEILYDEGSNVERLLKERGLI
jgi:hypothetical protein